MHVSVSIRIPSAIGICHSLVSARVMSSQVGVELWTQTLDNVSAVLVQRKVNLTHCFRSVLYIERTFEIPMEVVGDFQAELLDRVEVVFGTAVA